MEEVLIFRAKFKVLGLIPVLKCPTGRNFLPWKLRETANLSDRRNINSPSLTKTLPQMLVVNFYFCHATKINTPYFRSALTQRIHFLKEVYMAGMNNVQSRKYLR